jgi:class 3 adenylate cyclase
MLDLPFPVLNYIHSRTIANRNPAYLLVEKTGRLSNWGGQLTVYGITNLQKGEDVGKQVFFLSGLLPVDGSDLFLPCLKTETGLSIDIHIFTTDEGDWVLLLDATLEESQRQLVQQKANDLSLLRQENFRILNQHIGNDAAENLVQKLLNFKVRGERRNVTILFAGIYGFTTYSETNSPELVCRTLNLYLSSMLPAIVDEAGIVNKNMGDELMACFGVLPSTDSPAKQAIKAAFRMLEAVSALESNKGDEPIFNIGIGIASGSVVLGVVGSQNRKTFTAIGYHVNLAAQLKNQARSSEVIIDENTFNKVNNLHDIFSETSLLLPGIVEPIRIYSYLVK